MAAYDTDGGGTLSAEELQRMGAQGGRIFMADGDVSRSDSLRGHIDNRQLLSFAQVLISSSKAILRDTFRSMPACDCPLKACFSRGLGFVCAVSGPKV